GPPRRDDQGRSRSMTSALRRIFEMTISVVDVGGRAVDGQHVDARARLEQRLLVVGAGPPHFAANLDLTTVHITALHHDGLLTSVRLDAGLDAGAVLEMAWRDGAYGGQHADRHHDGHDDRDRSTQPDRSRDGATGSTGRQHEKDQVEGE